jgi:hypothetical protein
MTTPTITPPARKYLYNYAVLDPKYPGEPQFWALKGFGFGNAADVGWTFEFAPEATKTTQLLKSNLARMTGHISLAVFHDSTPSREPRWGVATSYDQIQIQVDTDLAPVRKIFLYRLRVLKVTRETDSYRHHIFSGPTKILYCKVSGGGSVSSGRD